MRLVLLGPPGAGKGTQASRLSDNFNMIHVSTGDMLRGALKNQTEAGLSAKAYMDKGELVPDEIVTAIVAERIAKDDASQGFMLDGFPRNTQQASELDKQMKGLGLALDLVLYFNTAEQTVITRLTGRRVCVDCGKIFHVKNMPPKVEGICDACGGKLIQRNDDKEETIKNRLQVYEQQTAPLLSYYKDQGLLREVRGDLNVDDLFDDIKELFGKESLSNSND